MAALRIIDIRDAAGFARIPPCADPRFDHRTCDYWEDADRGSRDSRPTWLSAPPAPAAPRPAAAPDNPFAPRAGGIDRRRDALAALLAGDDEAQDGWPAGSSAVPADDDPFGTPDDNPFAPAPRRSGSPVAGLPRKLALLSRGELVFGSYARVALEDEEPVAYIQFGPLSAYPRARRLRELYPRLPASPLPAVITCIATTAAARGRGHARDLVEDVCQELGSRGFAAVEVYPDLTRSEDETSAATPAFWLGCGFTQAIDDERFPVLRRELA